MSRCLHLAIQGAGYTAPNPLVGSVLVYNNRIIGEGYHQLYGEAHAEVNCINSVKEEDTSLIKDSTLFVSLEPCSHFGKTPPCTDLILRNKIKNVVIGCRDPFPEVNGKGIEILKDNGVDIKLNVLEEDCKLINKRFFTYHLQHRPYIILKWAQMSNSTIAGEHYKREKISNQYTDRIVHQWRAEEMSILVGTNTALYDDPELTTRLSPGKKPIRLVLDMDLRLPPHLKLFNTNGPVIIFNRYKHTLPLERISITDLNQFGVVYYQITEDVSIVHQVINALYQMSINSVIIEGGAQLLQSFIDENLWDEARIITNNQQALPNGIPAPLLSSANFINKAEIYSDTINYYRNPLFSI